MTSRSSLSLRLSLARAALLPLSPALWLYTIYRRRVLKKSAASTRGMWGNLPPAARRALRAKPAAPVVWIHAVSVGEVMAARVVARALRQVLEEQDTPARLFLSLTTDTGMDAARAALAAGEVDALGFYPIDAPTAVRRALGFVRPRVFVALETELWPLFLSECRARGVRTILVNGRVSDRLQRDGARLKFLFAPMLRGFDALLMRSPFDAERMQALAPGARIFKAGDVKLDAATPGHAAPGEAARWKQTLGIAPEESLWVAGSTHPGEEEIIARAYSSLKAEFPHLRLLIAPRHIERAGEVLATLQRANLPAALRSQTPASTCDAVIVLDTVGELAQIYAAAEVAFVGGSLIERGGHNMLEPVLRGVPVAYGPHIANFRVAAALVAEQNLGRQIGGEDELRQALASWLRERSGAGAEAARDEFAQRAATALEPHRGASRRVALAIAQAVRGEDVQLGG
jgi:3-deoxy-D-manno-octulosonic-acid transferase